MEQTINSLISELHRGTLVLSALSQLQTQQYGYSLRQNLADNGLDIEQGTLYPLLRRLEEQGLLDSEWDVSSSRPRRYYVVNAKGMEVLAKLTHEWQFLVRVMDNLLHGVETS